MIIYIHGFNSSALSFKAALVRQRMAALGRAGDFVCPELPPRPLEAMALLEALVRERRPGEAALEGCK